MPALLYFRCLFFGLYKKEVKDLGDTFGKAFKPMFIGGFFPCSTFCLSELCRQMLKILLNHQYVESVKNRAWINEYNGLHLGQKKKKIRRIGQKVSRKIGRVLRLKW